MNGTGVIDATQDLTVTWQINGTVPITGWRIYIMENTAASTVLFDSGWRHEYYEDLPILPPPIKPVYGRDNTGAIVPKSDIVTAAELATAGVVNNYDKGYKIRIDEQYSDYETPNTSPIATPKTLVQISPAFFMAMESASFNTSSWLSTYGRYAYFYDDVNPTAVGINHDNFDPLIHERWRLARQTNPEENIIEDTGEIYNAMGVLNKVYGILENGKDYAVRLTGELQSGIKLDTGWHNFNTQWTDTSDEHIHLKSYYVRDMPCLFVRFEADDGYDLDSVTSAAERRGWTIVRIRTDNGEATTAGIMPRGQTGFYDFGARNNTEYIYRAYYGLGAENGYCYETARPIKMRYYWNWAIVECEKESSRYLYLAPSHTFKNTMYHVKRVHQFQANVDSGSISNENTPYVENNFTPYPTVQKVGRKGLSGKLRAWVGGVKDTTFRDSVKMVDDLMDLSTRNTVKFLRDRKGNLRMIEISDAIVKETQDKYAEQPVQIEIPWVEIGDAKNCQIVSLLTDGQMARGDDIIDTTTAFGVGPDQDGYVTWTMDDEGYVGSEIQMNDGGQLEQVYDDSMDYVPADLEIDSEGKLKVETVIKADE